MAEPEIPRTVRREFIRRADPHARMHYYAAQQARGQFVTLQQALADFNSDPRSDKKLAVALTGGGARGAYESGVLEALVQAFQSSGVKPHIICGASAGAINSLCLFTDLMYPMTAPDPVTHFLSRQASVWKSVSVGNNGAAQLVDKPWLIEYLTGKRPIPLLNNLENAWRQLGQIWQATNTDVSALGPAAQALANALSATDASQLLQNIKNASATISGDITTLSTDWASVIAAWNSLDLDDIVTDPAGFTVDMNTLGAAIGTMVNGAPGLVWAITSAAVQIGSGDVETVISYLQGVVNAAQQVITQLGKIVTDVGALAGDLLALGIWLALVLAAVGWILSNLTFIFITIGATVALVDHVLGNEQLIALMKNFISDVMTAAAAPSPGRIIDEWKARLAAGRPVPALYVSATNLTADRQMLLALDQVQQLQTVAGEGTWVLDLASQGVMTDKLFTPYSGITDDLLPRACMTSSSIPFVFPPMRWQIDRLSASGQVETLNHVCVDGGVVDNTPIDLAVFAGATHIISVELTPLLDYNSQFDKNDSSMDNLVGVAGRSFITAMDGSLLRSISDVVDINATVSPAQRCQIYRLAPVIPKSASATDGSNITISPGLVDFDGVYNNNDNHLVMNLFDWFMQGYIDAKGWGPADVAGAAAADPIMQGYNSAPAASGFIKQPVFPANRLWAVGSSPLPLLADFTNIVLPNRTALADAAESR